MSLTGGITVERNVSVDQRTKMSTHRALVPQLLQLRQDLTDGKGCNHLSFSNKLSEGEVNEMKVSPDRTEEEIQEEENTTGRYHRKRRY